MNETKRTALPWEAKGWRVCALNVPGGIKVICDTANNKATRNDENAANAKYIVRACNGFEDLLRLAERVVEIFQPMQDKGQNGHTFELLLGRAQAAIAKATQKGGGA